MTDQAIRRAAPGSVSENRVAAAGALAGLTALLSAAACCVLPLALAAVGLGAGSLAAFVPYRWPLTAVALVMIAVGWTLYFRNRRACASEECEASGRSTVTLVMLGVATVAAAFSAMWGLLEQPLMRALGAA